MSVKNKIKTEALNYIFSTDDVDAIKKNLYDNLLPANYAQNFSGAILRIKKAMNTSEYAPDGHEEGWSNRDDIFATYLGIPENERHSNVPESMPRVIKSKYHPTIKNTKDNTYYALSKLTDLNKEALIREGVNLNINETKLSDALSMYFNDHTISKGRDNKGEYISYYDLWDLNPFRGRFGVSTNINLPTINVLTPHIYKNPYDYRDAKLEFYNKRFYPNLPNPFSKYLKLDKDLSLGIGKPVRFYDRIYLDDYYEVPKNKRGAIYLPEITITPRKKQGGTLNYLNYFK